MTEALGHNWRMIAQFDLTPDDVLYLLQSGDHRPDGTLYEGEAPAPDDPRPTMGTHNLIREEVVVACLRCEMAATPELLRTPCRGEPDGYDGEGAPLFGGKRIDEGPHPGSNLGSNVGLKAAPRPGRNDPCYCGSGKKFKLCHGR